MNKKEFLKPEHLDEAQRATQKTDQTDFGKLLMSLNLIGEREILMARAQEIGYAFADLDRIDIDPETVAAVPKALCVQHLLIPVKKDGHNLWIAIADPGNRAALEAVRQVANCRIIPVLAVPAAIECAIGKHFGSS